MSTAQSHLFWRPGGARPPVAAASLLDRDRADESAGLVYFNPNERLSLAQQRLALPIAENRRQLLFMVETFRTTVVIGHTGCGKTTQILQYLHEAGWTAGGRAVVCTQPRRVAAVAVAQRVAEEMGEHLGGTVGYAVRFDDCSSREHTRIKFVTDGTLLSEMMLDPLLSRYSVIMVDEAHERSVQTDVLLGLLKKLMRRRADLRLVIASATVDAIAFKDFFETCESTPASGASGRGHTSSETASVISLKGSGVHPVSLYFCEAPVSDYLEHAVETAWRIHVGQEDGDVLVFLTGQQEVEAAVSLLIDRALAERPRRALLALPMYAALSHGAQMRVFNPTPAGARKVIVATSIAETSVTIDGIVFVVDCGFTKHRYVNPSTGHEALVVVPESRANARQRAGRAGRVRPGACYVLMPEPSYHGLVEHTPPEMQRCSLAAVVLQLKALGIDNVLRFDFLSPPPPEALARALEMLFALGALTSDGQLSEPTGSRMARLPLEPPISAMLLGAEEEGCVAEVAMLAALISVQSVFTVSRTKDLQAARAPFAVYEGDSITLLNVARRYVEQVDRGNSAKANAWCRKHKLHSRVLERCLSIRGQLRRQLSKLGVEWNTAADRPSEGGTTGTDAIRRAVVRGFFMSAAQRVSGGTYMSSHRRATVHLNPNSVLWVAPPEMIVFHETVFTPEREYVLSATKIERNWLTNLSGARDFYELEKAS